MITTKKIEKTKTGVTNASMMFQKLQKNEHKQAALYLFCNFVSLLLITAYSAIMFSPTVLLVLPEGGDSRKQMMAIFILALFGCVVFTIYASSLFFRKKSRQLGTFMALGASRRFLAPALYKEVFFLSSLSSLLGILAGFPFVWLIWSSFRLFVVDSTEMKLVFDLKCLWVSALLFIIVVAFSCLMAHRYLKRTNIMDVVHEEHKNEPVKAPGRWCGPVGIFLLFAGAVIGYLAPGIYCNLFHAYYPPAWLNLLYVPVFIGLYMIMLHTVIHGWRSHKKQPYKNIIARSMMKFQGKQTVNNLLVSTVLIAGASFAVFYTPMLSVGQLISLNNRPYDYTFRVPDTQAVLEKEKVEALAADYGVSVTDYQKFPCLVLGMDGTVEIEGENNTSLQEYHNFVSEGRFFSESAFSALTKKTVSVEPGTYLMVSNDSETGTYWGNTGASQLTNMSTRETLNVSFAGFAHYELLAGRTACYVLDDSDYAAIADGLTDDWKETLTVFNAGETDSYAFAEALYHDYTASFDKSYAIPAYYDRVEKEYCKENGEVYWGDTDAMTQLSFDNPDSTEFRSYWLYMPLMTALDRGDFVRTYAVFLMLFLFIAIICFLAALIICYTRCMTLVLNNCYVFDDLKKLGASPAFLMQELKNQSGNVFKIPALVGMSAMFFLYALLMYGNDGVLTIGEIGGLAACLVILLAMGGVIWFVYRKTLKAMAGQIGI